MGKKIKLILGIVVILVSLAGTVVAVNNYFAKACDLRLVALRLDQKIMLDRYNAVQQRIWALEARFGENCKNASPEDKKEYQRLKLQLIEINRKLKNS